MELILLRHAPPAAALHRRYLGHTDVGIDRDLFDPAAIEPLLNERLDVVYSSDLIRCTATLEAMGIADYLCDPRLREVRFRPGIEGKNFGEIETMEEYRPEFLDSAEAWHRFVCDESPEAFSRRVASFLSSLPPYGTVLVCTHAGTIREILAQLSPEHKNSAPGYLGYTRVRVK